MESMSMYGYIFDMSIIPETHGSGSQVVFYRYKFTIAGWVRRL